MKKQFLLAGACVLISIASSAQISNVGGPISLKGKSVTVVDVPRETMPGFDLTQIEAEDLINDAAKDAPWRFGFKYETNLTPKNSGVWTDLPGGNRIWRTEIVASGALTINLTLEDVHFPEGAHLYLYDIAKTHTVGAYTSRNNHPSGELGTDLVHGDHIVVEYFEPAAVRGQGKFTINGVTHGYRSLNIVQKSLAKALNSSGDCNYDARCPVDPYVGGISAWDDQIRSVAMIVVNGSGICTGALINNSCDDGTPYFLTANHCLGGGTGNWLFRFNWDVPEGNAGMSCATTANTPTTFNNPSNYDQTTVNGATILVNGTGADHALLLLNNLTVGDATSWGLFYAGWNNNDTESAVNEVTGIHHPSGDIKKICRAYENGGANNIHHSTQGGAAVWYMDAWDEGVTEPGSSGSPLFDQNGRIIGQLYGGSAACQGTSANGFDYYGRLGVSWGLGIGTYLDPTSCGGGTGIINDGWDPNAATTSDDASIQSISSPDAELCGADFIPVVLLRNAGVNPLVSATILYNIDGATNLTYLWTGNLSTNASVAITLPTMSATAGPHVFNATSSNPNGTADTNPGNDASLKNFNVTVGGQVATLTIETDCWGYETYWEIVNAGTTTVVASGGNSTGIAPGGGQGAGAGDAGAYGNQMVITENLCLAAGCYDLIMYDDWGDGMDGTASNCAIDGDFYVEDAAGNILTQMTTISYDSDTSNFCLASPCNSTYNSTTIEPTCSESADGSITVAFVTGNASGATFNIGTGSQASPTFNGLTAGNYTVGVIDGDACLTNVAVVLNGPSALTSTSVITDETAGGDGAINLTVSGGTPTYTFAWTGPNGFTATTEDISALEDGTYSVTITDNNGCIVSVNNMVVEPNASLDENGESLFVIYPNPTNGIVNIVMTNPIVDDVAIRITDVTGRIIYNSDLEGVSFNIDLSAAADGTYFLHVMTNEKRTTQAIVLKK